MGRPLPGRLRGRRSHRRAAAGRRARARRARGGPVAGRCLRLLVGRRRPRLEGRPRRRLGRRGQPDRGHPPGVPRRAERPPPGAVALRGGAVDRGRRRPDRPRPLRRLADRPGWGRAPGAADVGAGRPGPAPARPHRRRARPRRGRPPVLDLRRADAGRRLRAGDHRRRRRRDPARVGAVPLPLPGQGRGHRAAPLDPGELRDLPRPVDERRRLREEAQGSATPIRSSRSTPGGWPSWWTGPRTTAPGSRAS